MAICPAGHTSESTDYCDTCGMPMGEQAVPGVAGPTTPGPDGAGVPAPADTAPQPCPNCGSMNPHDALFCEACGYDYTTGTLPRAGAEAADLLSIDTPVAATPDVGTPGVTPATTKEALEVADDEGMPEPGQEAPAALRSSTDAAAGQPEGAPAPEDASAADVGAAGVTPATTDEAHEVAVDEGMPEPGEEAPAAQRTSDGLGAGQAPVEWVAEVWIDPEWYRVQQSSEAMPSPGLPDVVPLRGRQVLVGRVSQSRNIHPDIDCGADTGCSRRQAQLSTDGQRWFIEDLESANGTYVGAMGEPMPSDPIQGRRELADDDRIYVGAWTRIVLRKATPDERAAFAG